MSPYHMTSNPIQKSFYLYILCSRQILDLLVIHAIDQGLMDDAAPHKQHSASPRMTGHLGHSHSTATVALQPPLDGKTDFWEDRLLFACTNQQG